MIHIQKKLNKTNSHTYFIEQHVIDAPEELQTPLLVPLWILQSLSWGDQRGKDGRVGRHSGAQLAAAHLGYVVKLTNYLQRVSESVLLTKLPFLVYGQSQQNENIIWQI